MKLIVDTLLAQRVLEYANDFFPLLVSGERGVGVKGVDTYALQHAIVEPTNRMVAKTVVGEMPLLCKLKDALVNGQMDGVAVGDIA